MSHINDGQNNEGDLVDNTTPTVATPEPAHIAEPFSPEEEEALKMILGEPAKPTELTPEQVEAMAKARDEVINFDVVASAKSVQLVIEDFRTVHKKLYDAIHYHVSMEWNKALGVQAGEIPQGEGEISAEQLKDLNAVRFIPVAGEKVDIGIELYHAVIRR